MKRDTKNKMIFGVCAGVADATEIPAAVVRIGFVLGALSTLSLFFWIYLLLGIFMPAE